MSAAKEIRNKIKSVENTRKITKAMEMVAASKMRKAQMRMKASRPYSKKIRDVVGHLTQANPEYTHGFMKNNENAKVSGLILVSTDKGLCGGLNTNVFRLALNKIREIESAGKEVSALSIGTKASGFLSRIDVPIIAGLTQIGDSPDVEKLNGALKVMTDEFLDGKLDEVFICYNSFVNTMRQEPILDSLLPLSAKDLEPVNNYVWDYIYEPDATLVIDDLLLRYVEALIYQAVVENLASEQSARMVAMKAATDNAGNVINELKLVYNKSRQASITKELSEIVAGAAAV
ncbi:MAG: F0F1 ATP synthase subunit gamma [Betaproteobacteria bacterium TMED82]|nr:MAG: F0F1 ATP synthase subunit gamma [Betaproteobacteria bacterium TMED82]|tara:strand:- start:24857 stop:25723 length:867 start_codon:yes stop_codon:yes gene_type:complete